MTTNRLGELLYESTVTQRRVTLAAAGAGVALATVCAGLAHAQWATWQWLVVLFVAFDLVGGVAAMCLPPAIRKVRPPDEPLRPLLFAAFHVHPLLLALALPGADWAVMSCLYGFAVCGVLLARATPAEFRASAALAWCAIALAVLCLLGMAPGLEWLAPAYLLKLVGAHAVRGPGEEGAAPRS